MESIHRRVEPGAHGLSKKVAGYLQCKGMKPLRLEFHVSLRELWMCSFTLMEENN